MASIIAIISSSNRYAYIHFPAAAGRKEETGVSLHGPLGPLVVWDDGRVEGPDEIAKWGNPDAAHAAYDDPEALERAQREAVGWLKA